MRYFLCFLSLFTHLVFAMPPTISGFYAGIYGTGSYLKDIDILPYNRPVTPALGTNPYQPELVCVDKKNSALCNLMLNATSGSIAHKGGGGGGAQLGYRFDCFRLEGQFLFNINQVNSMRFGSSDKFSGSRFNNEYYMKGATKEFVGLLNFYYDLRPPVDSGTSIFPYAGIGIGYAQLYNTINFAVPTSSDNTSTSPNYPFPPANLTNTVTSASSPVAQAIIGLDLAMDSYMDFFLDGRYLTSPNISAFGTPLQLVTVNFGVNFILQDGKLGS